MANKRKRGNGTGSIFKRLDDNGKVIGWRGQQYIGDKRKSYSGKTQQEVVDKMSLDRADYSRGVFVPDDDTTVGEWCEYWLEHKKKPYVKEQTYIHQRNYIYKYFLPYLKDVRLQDLTPELIQATYHKVFVEGTTANGKPFSDGTIHQATACFKGCLRDAVLQGKLTSNPHDRVTRPKGVAPKKVRPYSPEEQQKIVDFCKTSSNYLDGLFYFLIATGMRVGEAIVLTWDDIDLRKQTVTINKTLVENRGSVIVQDEPKTSKGNRTIKISDNVIKFLRKRKQEMDPEQNCKKLVFPNKRNNYIREHILRERFQKVCAILDIDYHDGLHSLRHSWGTRCLERNVPIKVVSEMLGHEDVLTTMNIYQSVLPGQQEEVATIMNDLF